MHLLILKNHALLGLVCRSSLTGVLIQLKEVTRDILLRNISVWITRWRVVSVTFYL